jgi:tetratricopeptide (TPR) repeat protein
MDDNNKIALSIAEQVLSQDPDNADARELLFDALEEENRLPEAERVILGLLKDYPEHAPFFGEYAMLMIRALLIKKARALAEEGLKYDPDEMNCLSARLLCDFIEQRKGAQTHSLQQMLVRDPDGLQTLHLLRFALWQRGKYRAAYRIAQEILRADPDDEETLELVLVMKVTSHWSMYPFRPILRWGWTSLVVVWMVGIVMIKQVASLNTTAGGYIGLGLIAYTIYILVWPLLANRWLTGGKL